ncbi:hypothetical protein [Rhizobium sp. MHM7A]|uniref:hypothetical protein n=1 Tax=Rhizobium sp. MHM7A TaxID=2583233 RepID=UPI0011065EE4|nr:hypothetical protein [Rhizobium sp. MHM7A]TLX16372.1 hypothetical protein FFR93_03300 [Rhizobium sp. MHM7A]
MILHVFNRRGMCGAISASALLAAMLYARGTDILVEIGYIVAIGGVGAGLFGGLLIALGDFFNSNFAARTGHAICSFYTKQRISVIWATRCVIVAITASTWYSTTFSSPEFFAVPLMTPTQAAVLAVASIIASICATPFYLSKLPETDRAAIAPIAHVLGWFVVSILCIVLMTSK